MQELLSMDEIVARAQKMLDERAAAKAARDAKYKAERKAFWETYNKQLAMSTPNQGGTRKRRMQGRVLGTRLG